MAREYFSKVVAIWWPTFAFVCLGFDHVVANMFFVPMAIFLGSPDITVGYYIWKSMIPALIGNILGGGLFVGVMYWVRHLSLDDDEFNWLMQCSTCISWETTSLFSSTASPFQLTKFELMVKALMTLHLPGAHHLQRAKKLLRTWFKGTGRRHPQSSEPGNDEKRLVVSFSTTEEADFASIATECGDCDPVGLK